MNDNDTWVHISEALNRASTSGEHDMSKQLEEISFGPVDGPHKVVKHGDPDFEYIHRIYQHQVGLAEARAAEPSKPIEHDGGEA